MTKPKNNLRIRNKEHGTVLRVIRAVPYGGEVAFKGRDETHGGLCYLPIKEWNKGNWEVI